MTNNDSFPMGRPRRVIDQEKRLEDQTKAGNKDTWSDYSSNPNLEVNQKGDLRTKEHKSQAAAPAPAPASSANSNRGWIYGGPWGGHYAPADASAAPEKLTPEEEEELRKALTNIIQNIQSAGGSVPDMAPASPGASPPTHAPDAAEPDDYDGFYIADEI